MNFWTLEEIMLDLGGTYRAVSPQETLAKIEPMLWDKFGITRVANITGLDNLDIPTYIAIRPLSKFFSTAQGKGMTHELAKISAMMESIEGWHAERIEEPHLFGSSLQFEKKYPLVDLALVANQVLKVPSEQLYRSEIPWMRGLELNSGREIFFPADLIHLDLISAHNLKTRPCLFAPTSNGLASGNTFEEAVCHAVCEVIERHCHYKSDFKPYRHIDLATITSYHLRQLLEHLTAKSLRLQLIDMTDEINVPVFLATLTDLSGVHALGVFFGSGAHISSEVALSRAITEAIQSRLTIIGGSREDIYPSVYRDLSRDSKYIQQTPGRKALYPFIETSVPADFSQCLDLLLMRLKQVGFEQVIVFDHTIKELGIPVVNVLIPGLQLNRQHHIHYAYSPDEFLA
ncbi:YcaO-like family protein [bacterium]|nr:YcaO-like family protein [bacterium]